MPVPTQEDNQGDDTTLPPQISPKLGGLDGTPADAGVQSVDNHADQFNSMSGPSLVLGGSPTGGTEMSRERTGIRSKVSADSNLRQVIELAKRRGFVFQSSEIYGGFPSAYDYGPLGTLLISNIKRIWEREISQKNRNVVLMDSAIIGHPRIWEASGHTEAFNDPLIEDIKTHQRHRADKLLEEQLGLDTSKLSFEEMARIIKERNVRSPEGNPLGELRTFNLMVEALMGSTTDSKESVYLRGETCQGIFVNFKNLVDSARVTVPFGVLQIGKAFRNEITARQFVIRTREFEQMEFEFFFDPEDGKDWYQHWQDRFTEVLDRYMGIPRERIRLRELPREEMSHYAKKQADFEVRLPNGDWLEISPMNDRGDWDLSRHSKYSGVTLDYRDPMSGKRFIPNVIETSFGVGRLLYVLMDSGFCEELVPGENEKRFVLKLSPHIAPYTCAVLPLSKKPELQAVAERLHADLSDQFNVSYDENASIGKRYRRQDEIGTPWCITVDFDSLKDQAVTIRDRDTMAQERVSLSHVADYIHRALSNASSR